VTVFHKVGTMVFLRKPFPDDCRSA